MDERSEVTCSIRRPEGMTLAVLVLASAALAPPPRVPRLPCEQIGSAVAHNRAQKVLTTAHNRRAFLERSVPAVLFTALAMRPGAAHASFADDVTDAGKALTDATAADVPAALERLLDLSREYDGMPTDALRKQLMEAVRAKRDELRGQGWGGELEETYLRLQRQVDPWRVTELQGRAQVAILLFAPVYVALLAVQQFVPGLFTIAYAVAAAVIFLPLLQQILFG